MILVAFRVFEEDGLSVTNSNGQTPIMSPTCWLTHPTRVTGHLARENGSYESSAMLQVAVSEHQIETNSLISVNRVMPIKGFIFLIVLWFLARNQGGFHWIF
jgi:hypothetical protein